MTQVSPTSRRPSACRASSCSVTRPSSAGRRSTGGSIASRRGAPGRCSAKRGACCGRRLAMPPDALAGAERVLIARLDNLGDVVLTAPLFRALREHVPNAELTLLGSPGGALAAPLVPSIDRVETVRAVWQDLGGRLPFDADRELEFIARLRAGRYDVAIICTSFSQTPYAAGYAAY